MLSVWTVKAGVNTALQALIPDSADIVQIGLPMQAPSNQDTRRVYVLNVPIDDPVPFAQPGSQVRTEDFVVPIVVEVVNFAGNSLTGCADTEVLMGTLVDAISALCDDDPSWGQVCSASGLSLASERTDPIADQAGGWIAHAVLNLRVRKHGA